MPVHPKSKRREGPPKASPRVQIPAKEQMGNGSMKPQNPAQHFDSTRNPSKPTIPSR